MFTMARIISSTTCSRLLYAREAPYISRPYRILWTSLPKENGLVIKDHFLLRNKNVIYKYPFKSHRRQFADKLYEKGKGDELNYFLKLGREQFMKIRKDRIKEIADDIKKLEEEIQKMEKQSSRQAQKKKEHLENELKALRDMLDRFHKSFEKDNE
ncbi:uncharacterized protein LOC108022750 [Drosophila biarmipes]|uniref:uncharacterized protein LOC108022750 n=1 Tax=Drosophila biarmipes TaxID=125945 RepID=UPI0007E735AE|nr:uncharacterized protein LOC108022750 [Drosophila biarmipes]